MSFVDAFMRPLLEATARLLYRLFDVAFPLAFVANGDVYDLLTRVRKFFQEGIDETLHRCNLAAIKTSTVFSPAFLLLNSSTPPCSLLICKNSSKSSASLKEDAEPVPPDKSGEGLRTYPPSFCTRLPCSKVCTRGFRHKPKDRPWAHRCHRPCVAWSWQRWRQFGIGMNRSLLCLRYVENRLWISEPAIAVRLQLFLNNRFYGGDVTGR